MDLTKQKFEIVIF